jgi:hypothetical protein
VDRVVARLHRDQADDVLTVHDPGESDCRIDRTEAERASERVAGVARQGQEYETRREVE